MVFPPLANYSRKILFRKDFSLQKTDPTFKDTNEKYYRAFQNILHKLDGKTSEGHLCIEKYLIESEMEWNKRRREAKLDRGCASKASSPDGSIYIERRGSSLTSLFGWTSAVGSEFSTSHEQISESSTVVNETDEFMLDDDHDHGSFLKRWMVTKSPRLANLFALSHPWADHCCQLLSDHSSHG
jgi:alpha-1,3-glucan synthase